MQITERRRRRSEQVVQALSYQLSHLSEQEQLTAFVLVDRDGLLVAAAPSEIDAEALSAICPLLHHGAASSEEVVAILGHHQDKALVLQPLLVQEEQMFLFSVGEESGANRAVAQAAGGVHRIFKMFS